MNSIFSTAISKDFDVKRGKKLRILPFLLDRYSVKCISSSSASSLACVLAIDSYSLVSSLTDFWLPILVLSNVEAPASSLVTHASVKNTTNCNE